MVKLMMAIVLIASVTAASAQTRFGLKVPPNASIIPVQGSISCGIPPIPPVGCKIGSCVCDQTGQKCQWQFICN